MGYSSWGHKESDMTEVTEHTHTQTPNVESNRRALLFVHFYSPSFPRLAPLLRGGHGNYQSVHLHLDFFFQVRPYTDQPHVGLCPKLFM